MGPVVISLVGTVKARVIETGNKKGDPGLLFNRDNGTLFYVLDLFAHLLNQHFKLDGTLRCIRNNRFR